MIHKQFTHTQHNKTHTHQAHTQASSPKHTHPAVRFGRVCVRENHHTVYTRNQKRESQKRKHTHITCISYMHPHHKHSIIMHDDTRTYTHKTHTLLLFFLPSVISAFTQQTAHTTTTTCNTHSYIIHSHTFVRRGKIKCGQMEDGASTRFHDCYGLQTALIRFFRHRYHLLADLGAPVCGTVLALSRQSRDGPPIKTAPDWSNTLFGLF